jgi:Bifunctional DNA primase/polymerase, N-terminal
VVPSDRLRKLRPEEVDKLAESISRNGRDFRAWQAEYAAHGIATFPVDGDKRPMVTNFTKFGLRASTDVASRFAHAPGIAFMCGKHSRITIVDIDSPDERLVADAIDRHGYSPIVIRTASGNHHIPYRHNGEKRRIRPWPELPIDILGANGFAVAPPSTVIGTKLTVKWPPKWDWMYNRGDTGDIAVKALICRYCCFNPHLTLRGTWDGKVFVNVPATNPTWRKWGPRDPTSPHWYNESRLQRYLAAHVARNRELGLRRTVKDFLGEFSGLARTGIRRKILEEVGCSHQTLAQFFGKKKVNDEGIAKLLAAMCKYSKPVNPKRLGIIGREHFKERFINYGGSPKAFEYARKLNVDDAGVPYIIETAFGPHKSALEPNQPERRREFITGANWSVAIGDPFRQFGSTGTGLESLLSETMASRKEPVIFFLHLAKAFVQYLDRGKTSIDMSGDDDGGYDG